MRTRVVLLVAALLSLPCRGAETGSGAYRPEWPSLTRHEHPQWLLDAKFGIYAHWGVYAVPAYKSEWYGKMMYDPNDKRGAYEYHRKTFGPQNQFGYKDFISKFRAEKFDPAQWAELIRESGARYAGIAVVHHDGFGLWDSYVYRWNAGKMGPKRDLYGDLVKALRARDLKIIATEHHMRTFDWYLPNPDEQEKQKKEGVDLYDPKYADFYWNHYTSTKSEFIKIWKRKLTEVIDKYHPDVLWFDGGDFTSPEVAEPVMSSLAHYYNQAAAIKAPVEVLNKFAGTMKFNFPEDFGILTYEAGRDRPEFVEKPWIDDESIAEVGWGYAKDLQLRSTREIILGLADRVARGGGLLLSLAPMADGTIPENQKAVLRDIGDWLKVNGEAIYGTRKWSTQAEGSTAKLIFERARHKGWTFEAAGPEDIRFTRKGNDLFAIALGWPDKGVLRIKTLKQGARLGSGGISGVSLLGVKGPVKWKQTADALEVQLPTEKPCKYAYSLKIAVKGSLQ
jgi:alpha-L-fucosidase